MSDDDKFGIWLLINVLRRLEFEDGLILGLGFPEESWRLEAVRDAQWLIEGKIAEILN